jgi:hypothetical protein
MYFATSCGFELCLNLERPSRFKLWHRLGQPKMAAPAQALRLSLAQLELGLPAQLASQRIVDAEAGRASASGHGGLGVRLNSGFHCQLAAVALALARPATM